MPAGDGETGDTGDTGINTCVNYAPAWFACDEHLDQHIYHDASVPLGRLSRCTKHQQHMTSIFREQRSGIFGVPWLPWWRI